MTASPLRSGRATSRAWRRDRLRGGSPLLDLCYGFFAPHPSSRGSPGVEYRQLGRELSAGRCTTCVTASVSAAGLGIRADRGIGPDTTPSPSQLDRVCWRASSACQDLDRDRVAVLTWLVIIGGVRSIGRPQRSSRRPRCLVLGRRTAVIVLQRIVCGDVALVFARPFLRAGMGASPGCDDDAMRYGSRAAYANEAGYGTRPRLRDAGAGGRAAGYAASWRSFVISF